MSKWDDYKVARDSGQTMQDVIAAGIASRATAYRLEKQYGGGDGVQTVEKPPDGIRAEGFDGSKKTGEKRRGVSRIKNAPITEETAGLILKGLSDIAAFLAAEQELALTEEEVDLLERPLTESLALMPKEIGNAVNKYAAPGLFVSQFVAIYARKMSRIAVRRAGFGPRQLHAVKNGQTPVQQQQRNGAPAPAAEPAIPPNLEAIRAAAASVKMANESAAAQVDGTSGSGAPTVSTGVLEVEDRKSEFEA